MKFEKITEAHKNFGNLVRFIEIEDEDVILVKNGKPLILMKKMSADDLEDYIVAKHFGVDKLAKQPVGETVGLEEVKKRLGLSDSH